VKAKAYQSNQFFYESPSALLKQGVQSNIFSNKVRDYYIKMIDEKTPITKRQTILVHFKITPYMFKKRLDEEGMTFEAIVSEVRCHIAKDLLVNTNLSVVRISSRLGFNSSQAFRRSFRKWTMLSPKEYRQAALII
jgi:AraC-like DNA-binding protein